MSTDACVCGHSIEEHGDPKYPGSTACAGAVLAEAGDKEDTACNCVAYEREGRRMSTDKPPSPATLAWTDVDQNWAFTEARRICSGGDHPCKAPQCIRCLGIYLGALAGIARGRAGDVATIIARLRVDGAMNLEMPAISHLRSTGALEIEAADTIAALTGSGPVDTRAVALLRHWKMHTPGCSVADCNCGPMATATCHVCDCGLDEVRALLAEVDATRGAP